MTSRAKQQQTGRMPVVFVGHGSPINAMEDNRWSRGFCELRSLIPKPVAIVAISAHWYTRGTHLTDNEEPETIHDFSGFPPALYQLQYPARGDVELAERVHALIPLERVSLRSDWGLDHGTWSVLRWMYPGADVPVIQLSMARRLHEPAHYEIGRSLAPLREEGVLILGSGNIVHNLNDAVERMDTQDWETPLWAREFDEAVAEAVLQRDTEALLTMASGTPLGQRSHPSLDHWLPLIYALGATHEDDDVHFNSEGFDLGSISMRNIVWM